MASRYSGPLLTDHTDECTVGMQLVRAALTDDQHVLKHGENAHTATQLKHTQ